MKLSRIYLGLLLNQGHLTDPKLLRELAGADTAATEAPAVSGPSSPSPHAQPKAPRRRLWPTLRDTSLSPFR